MAVGVGQTGWGARAAGLGLVVEILAVAARVRASHQCGGCQEAVPSHCATPTASLHNSAPQATALLMPESHVQKQGRLCSAPGGTSMLGGSRTTYMHHRTGCPPHIGQRGPRCPPQARQNHLVLVSAHRPYFAYLCSRGFWSPGSQASVCHQHQTHSEN